MFLVDTGDVMSPELSKETRVKLCALTMMLSSYQVREALGWGGHPACHSRLPSQPRECYRLGCLASMRVLEGASERKKMFLVKVDRWVVLKVQ